ncbi:MAG: hypothetical protein KAR47_11680, partial [Planctomycetes bacterium]|nr:hypothetical protein [Planctomycetota bacterium]
NGFGKSMMGYVARGYHGTVKRMTLFSSKTGLLGVLTLMIFGLCSFVYKHNTTESLLFFTAAVVFIPYTIFARYQSILGGLQKFKLAMTFRWFALVSMFVVTVIVLLVLKKGVLLFGASNLILQSLFYSVFFFYSLRLLSNDRVDKGYLKHSIAISLVVVVNQMISPGVEIYLNHALGGASLAFFVIAKRLSAQATGITKPMMQPVAVRLTKRGKVGHGIALLKLVPLLLVFGVLLYGCFFAGIVFLGPLVIDDSYKVCLFYAKILGLTIIFRPLFSLLMSHVIFEKNNKAYAFVQYGEQIMLFIGYVVFIPIYGVMGVIITNIAAFLIKASMLLFLIKKDLGHDLAPVVID